MTLSLSAFYAPYIEQRSDDPDYEYVVKLIGDAALKCGMPVRADATCFLADTVMSMLVEPMRNLHPETYNDGFREILFADICAVIEQSIEVSNTRKRSEITSTSAIEALGNVVEELNVSSLTTMGKVKGELKIQR